MKCYICEKTVRVGGTRYAIAEAIGICHDCGIGVCIEHSRKSHELGAPLLCPECTQKREQHETPILTDRELAHQHA